MYHIFVNTRVSQFNDKFIIKRSNSQEYIYCKDMYFALRFKEILISQYY